MNSRTKILAAVKANLPEPSPLPKLDDFWSDDASVSNKTDSFIQMAKSVSSQALRIEKNDIEALLEKGFPSGRRFIHSVYLDQMDPMTLTDPHDLDSVELAIIDARFGVVENGAVWVDEENLGYRALPFICQHLVVILKEEDFVENMNDAYRLVNSDAMPSYGLFIGGPSKTADIEQALVLGAHGSLSNTILIIP